MSIDWRKAAEKTSNPAKKRRFMFNAVSSDLKHQIIKCGECPLADTRTHAVPWDGGRGARLVLVGEAPGFNEDREGVPFVGRAGKILNEVLEGIGLSRDQVWVMNTVCCRPPNNRVPTQHERVACQPHRTAQLALSGCWIGVTLGASATETLTGRTAALGTLRGHPIWNDGVLWVPTWHPAYVLRNMSKRPQLADDLYLALRLADGSERLPLPTRPEHLKGNGQIRSVMKQGWALVHSHVLGEQILYVKDDMVKVPAAVADLPRYTLEELLHLRAVGNGELLLDEDLQRVHLVKKELGATVMEVIRR